jgi:hypothetical protein
MRSEKGFGRHSGPANVSRLHESATKAREGSVGELLFQQNQTTKVITNSLFNSALIKYDISYCTTIIDSAGRNRIPTLSYFNKILKNFKSSPLIVDIGCGQGEFVEELRRRGLDAVGYDPVLRNTKQFLHDRLWSQQETSGDLYVMRCVLPHIEDPWEFLDSIWLVNPNAFILIEYQSWHWISRNSVWNQICHDHVHQFRLSDFLDRNLLVDSGTFEEGEWEWALLGKTRPIERNHSDESNLISSLKKIDSDREASLSKIKELSSVFSALIVWGGAAKGAMLAYSLLDQLEIELRVVDQDQNRAGRYLEASGIQVHSPSEITLREGKNLILAANPRHLNQIKSLVGDSSIVTSVTEILK